MAEAAQAYRTKEEALLEEEEKQHQIRFSDISLTAAWIAASYQAFSPESIREGIQNQWVNKITKEVAQGPKFKQYFEARKKGETRQEHAARSRKALQLKSQVTQLTQDLTREKGNGVYQKGIGTTVSLRQSVTDYIDNDYQGLSEYRNEVLNEISRAQQENADVFKKQNDKNNKRYKKSIFYRRKEENLAKLQQEEKIQHQAEVVARRDLHSSLKPIHQEEQVINNSDLSKKEKKLRLKTLNQQSELLIQRSQLHEQAVTNVLRQQPNIEQDQFRKYVNKEIKTLQQDRRFRKYAYGSEQLEAKSDQIDRLWVSYQNKTNEPRVSASPLPVGKSATTEDKPFGKTPFDKARDKQDKQAGFSFKDLPGQTQIKTQINNYMSKLMTKLSRTISNKLPSISNFFGGSKSVVSGARTVARASRAASSVSKGVKTASSAFKAARGLGVLLANPELWPVIAIVAVIVVLIGASIFLIMSKSSAIAPPHAVTQAQINPTTTALQTTPTPTSPVTNPPLLSPGQNLSEVVTYASQATCVPEAMIMAISRREAGAAWGYSDSEFQLYNSVSWWNSSSITTQSIVCSGYGYNTCTNQIPSDSKFGLQYCGSGPRTICGENSTSEVMGVMQINNISWDGRKSRVETELKKLEISRPADRRIILDAFIGAGIKMKDNSGSAASACTNWTAQEVVNTAKGYYGKCIYNVSSNTGNYCLEVCDYYNQYGNQTVNCSSADIT